MGPQKFGALCGCTGCTPMGPGLLPGTEARCDVMLPPGSAQRLERVEDSLVSDHCHVSF
jgi:hypothetical protein